jgi:hypothetical protein
MAITHLQDGYFFTWTAENNTVTIVPANRRAKHGALPFFGLGNAKIRINTRTLPTELVEEITDDSTGQGLLPTSPFGLKRWYSMPENMGTVPLNLTGFLGWNFSIDIPQATGGSVKQVASVPIIQNGYGCEEIVGDAPRLNW